MRSYFVGRKRVILAVALIILLVLFLIVARYITSSRAPATHPPREGRLVVAFASTNDDHVDFYQNGNQVCVDSYSANPLDRPEFFCHAYEGKLAADNVLLDWSDQNLDWVPNDYPYIVGADWSILNNLVTVTGGHVSFIDINSPRPIPVDEK
ncbi:hypothetical protein KRX54_00090 [Actinomycetaceae bacterium TAE3-ERU4]|nr:hypothetical protein [Actinomycetaceae bacterium TAE3-ERU4]